MDVSIIIVNYNSIDLTIDCVNSIFQQTADVKFEIIIVDNASKNKEAERLQAEFENSVKMIETETNLGTIWEQNTQRGIMYFFLIPIRF